MDFAATALAALIRATVGSLGAVALGRWLDRRHERERLRREVAQNHLTQLVDALESLWYRLDNVTRNFGQAVMSDDYYVTSSSYVIGVALAQKRRMMLDGAYALLNVIEKDSAATLRTRLRE